jgi:hypothetical protein
VCAADDTTQTSKTTYTYVYALLLDNGATYSHDNLAVVAANTEVADTITMSSLGKLDVNASNEINIDDAVAISGTANQYASYFTDDQKMKTVLRADVDRNGVVSVTDDGIKIKQACAPVAAQS